MERTKPPTPSLSEQMKRRVSEKNRPQEMDGNFGKVISTGSTLLDLAISAGRVRGGGLPGGVLVEVFGPSGSGKTVLLSEIAGDVQRKGGEIKYFDPEARLNKPFARLFGLELGEDDYHKPDKVPEVFSAVRSWEPKGKKGVIHGVFADSLAALSTDQEMTKEEGDKMGMRRAKEFSEELRKTCRILAQNNFLMVCSNQVRINMDAGPYGQKYSTPGGLAFEFYSSLRLRMLKPEKIKERRTVAGKEVSRVVGVETQIEVAKSSIWKPFHTVPVIILFDYGVDDVQANLQFIKDYSRQSVYSLEGQGLDKSMAKAIQIVEDEELEGKVREEVVDLWDSIESKFETERKPKR